MDCSPFFSRNKNRVHRYKELLFGMFKHTVSGVRMYRSN